MGTGKTKAPETLRRLCIAPDLALEVFGQEGIVFLAESERWITVNRAAGVLLRHMRRAFGRHSFTLRQMVLLFRKHYHLTQVQAFKEAKALCREWRSLDILRDALPPKKRVLSRR